MSRTVWLDASAGASGDMLLGALVGAGVPVGVLGEAVDRVAPGQVRLREERVSRAGLAATRCHVEVADAVHHRPWREVARLLDTAGLHEDVRALAHDVFERLARAEGAVHGIDPDDVEFHEVGALDAIADVVGVCAGIAHLGLPHVTVSPVAVGSGTVAAAHGRMPVPVPAVAELLRGVASYAGSGEGEACTPTGAALLVTLADAWGPQPAMVVDRVGVGAGARDPEGVANVTRLLLGADAAAGAPAPRPDVVLECNVDDLDPRLWPTVLAALLAAGASDAWLSPVLMKKGRPAHTLHVLVEQRFRDRLREEVWRQTSTLGLRESAVLKHQLDRTMVAVDVEGQQVAVKLGLRDGEVVTAQPEYDDVAAAAQALGLPARVVLARAAAAAQRRTPGAAAP